MNTAMMQELVAEKIQLLYQLHQLQEKVPASQRLHRIV